MLNLDDSRSFRKIPNWCLISKTLGLHLSHYHYLTYQMFGRRACNRVTILLMFTLTHVQVWTCLCIVSLQTRAFTGVDMVQPCNPTFKWNMKLIINIVFCSFLFWFHNLYWTLHEFLYSLTITINLYIICLPPNYVL